MSKRIDAEDELCINYMPNPTPEESRSSARSFAEGQISDARKLLAVWQASPRPDAATFVASCQARLDAALAALAAL